MINKIVINDIGGFALMQSDLSKKDFIVLDTETTGFIISQLDIIGISLYNGGENSYYIPLAHTKGKNFSPGKNLSSIGIIYEFLKQFNMVVAQNIVYDTKVLSKYNAHLDDKIWFDTMVAAHLIDENRKVGLKRLAKTELNMVMKEFSAVTKDPTKFCDVPIEKAADYSCDDVIATYKLFELYKKQMTKLDLKTLFKDIEMPFLKVIKHMEETGILIDKERFKKSQEEVEKEIIELEQQIVKVAGISTQSNLFGGASKLTIEVDSPKQLANLLYVKLNLPVLDRTPMGQPKTGIDTLAKLKDKHSIITPIIRYKKLKKLLNAFILPLPRKVDYDGRVRCSFHDCRTRTGRLSSSDPNLQQLPRQDEFTIRGCFIASPGTKLIVADYSQEELRLAAHITQDENMLKAYEENLDLHLSVANKVFDLKLYEHDLVKGSKEYEKAKTKFKKERHLGKTLNFGILYGAGDKGISNLTGASRTESKKLIDNYFKAFPQVKHSIKKTQSIVMRDGFVRNIFGRYRNAVADENGCYSNENFRQAFNFLIQGCIEGNMRILEKNKGYVPIKDLVNKNINVWDGDKFVKAKVVYSGKKEAIITTFKNGQKIITSPDHKFLTINTANAELWKTPLKFSKIKTCPEKVRITKIVKNFKGESIIESIPISTHWKAPNGVANQHDYSFKQIKNNYNLGLILGRLASDGSFHRGSVSWIIAEHEYNILDKLETILKPFKYTKKEKQKKYLTKYGKKHKPITYLSIYSSSLFQQCIKMNIKNHIPIEIFSNKERLRGFLCGFFDGDGGVNVIEKGSMIDKHSSIHLSFGKRHNSTQLPLDIQQALCLFGIKSSLKYYSYCVKIVISVKDNILFKKEIGFLNKLKQNKIIEYKSKCNPKQGRVQSVDKVIRTNKKIDMYDVVNSETGRFMCEGLIVHNSAADVLRIAMVKVYEFFKEHNFEAKILVTVHDEIVCEVPEDKVDFYKTKIKELMESAVSLSIPLEVDIGVGDNYADAK